MAPNYDATWSLSPINTQTGTRSIQISMMMMGIIIIIIVIIATFVIIIVKIQRAPWQVM